MESLEQCLDHILQTLENNGDTIFHFADEGETKEYLELFTPLGVTMLQFCELLDDLQKKEFLFYHDVEKIWGPTITNDSFYHNHLMHPQLIHITLKGKYFIRGGGFSGKKSSSKPVKFKPNTLLAIWNGTPEQYRKVIDQLKKIYAPIGIAFVKEDDNKLVWVYKGRGWVQYLQAFIWQCHKKGLINEEVQLSAPQYREIMSNTFNLPVFDAKPFQSLLAKVPLDKYLEAFSFIDSL